MKQYFWGEKSGTTTELELTATIAAIVRVAFHAIVGVVVLITGWVNIGSAFSGGINTLQSLKSQILMFTSLRLSMATNTWKMIILMTLMVLLTGESLAYHIYKLQKL